jgi:hypothetical protein
MLGSEQCVYGWFTHCLGSRRPCVRVLMLDMICTTDTNIHAWSEGTFLVRMETECPLMGENIWLLRISSSRDSRS